MVGSNGGHMAEIKKHGMRMAEYRLFTIWIDCASDGTTWIGAVWPRQGDMYTHRGRVETAHLRDWLSADSPDSISLVHDDMTILLQRLGENVVLGLYPATDERPQVSVETFRFCHEAMAEGV